MWIAIAAAAVVVILLIVAAMFASSRRKARTARLRDEFGPEYDRSVRDMGKPKAERVLLEREQRAKTLSIQTMTRDQAATLTSEWSAAESRFLDAPVDAIARAEQLIAEAMGWRGYPVGEFDQRVSDLSIYHPSAAVAYRDAHAITLRNRKGQATTEELRQAMVGYRSLLTELMEVGDNQRPPMATTSQPTGATL